jgi:hypothetical protein
MLFAVRDLLRREVDDATRLGVPVFKDLEYTQALMALCDSLRDLDATAVVLLTPGFTIRRDQAWHEGWVVYGWTHILRYPDGQEIYPHDEVSFHHYHWRAKLAARLWMRLARNISERIATQLASSLEVDADSTAGA